jgi:hypothetical protein
MHLQQVSGLRIDRGPGARQEESLSLERYTVADARIGPVRQYNRYGVALP